MSEDYTKDGELLGATTKDELWSGVEAFFFAEDSNSLSNQVIGVLKGN